MTNRRRVFTLAGAATAAVAAVTLATSAAPALGNPRDNREPFRRGDPGSRARFQELLAAPPARAALAELESRIPGERVALLCFERDADRCHRQLVSEQLLGRDPGLAVRHL